MTSRTKQQVVTEFRCSEILDAARRVFSKRGFRDATVDEIAAAAGLAKATVYQYFPSKQQLYLATLRHGFHQLIEHTDREMDAAHGIRAKIEAFVRTRLNYLECNRDFFAVYHSEFGNITHPAAMNREFRTLYHKQLEHLENVLRAAAEREEIADVPVEALATTIYEATRGLMLRRSLGWTEASVDQHVSALMNIIWKGVATR